MNKVIYFLTVFACIVFLNCCKNLAGSSNHYFDDIDIYNLKGVNPINHISYPCFEVDSVSNTERKLTFWFSKGVSNTFSYTWEKNYWKASYVYNEDTIKRTTWYYIFEDKMLTLDYPTDSNGKILGLEDFETSNKNNADTFYYSSTNLKFMPAEGFDKIDLNDFPQSLISKFTRVGDSLRVDQFSYAGDSSNSLINSETHYLGKHSVFWWKFFMPH